MAIYPLIKLGYGLTFKQFIVLGYSGLRGAVSLILALTVYLDTELNETVRDLVIFHTAGIALLTLLINGTTIGLLVKWLGMMRMPKVKKRMLKHLMKAYRKEVSDTISELHTKKNFNNCEWDDLKKLACADKIRDEIFKNRAIKIEESDLRQSMFIREEDIVLDQNEYTEEELYFEAKHRYFTTLKGIYWHFYEQGKVSSRAVLILMESADRVIDHMEDKSKDFKFIEGYIKPSWYIRIISQLRADLLCRLISKYILYNQISFEYDVVINFVEAHEECQHLIEEILAHDDILQRVKEEAMIEVKRAAEMITNELEDTYPEVAKAVQHKRGGFYLINRMRNFVLNLIKHGQIEEKEAKFFIKHLDKEESGLTLGNLKLSFDEIEADFERN